jgi:hypothetical protein
MSTIRVNGNVHENHQLTAEVPNGEDSRSLLHAHTNKQL